MLPRYVDRSVSKYRLRGNGAVKPLFIPSCRTAHVRSLPHSARAMQSCHMFAVVFRRRLTFSQILKPYEVPRHSLRECTTGTAAVRCSTFSQILNHYELPHHSLRECTTGTAGAQTFSYCHTHRNSHSSLAESDNALIFVTLDVGGHIPRVRITRYMSRHVTSRHVTGHRSHVTCHMSHVTCHMLKTKYYKFNMARAMQTCCCLLLLIHMSHVTVTCYMSHVTCHTTHVTCHM